MVKTVQDMIEERKLLKEVKSNIKKLKREKLKKKFKKVVRRVGSVGKQIQKSATKKFTKTLKRTTISRKVLRSPQRITIKIPAPKKEGSRQIFFNSAQLENETENFFFS